MFAESSHLRSRQRTSKPAKCIQFSYIPCALPRFNAPRFFERPTSFLSFHRCRRPSSPSKGCPNAHLTVATLPQVFGSRPIGSNPWPLPLTARGLCRHCAAGQKHCSLWTHWRRTKSETSNARNSRLGNLSGPQNSRMGESPRVASQEFCKFLPLEI